jgi:hypothetical protein
MKVLFSLSLAQLLQENDVIMLLFGPISCPLVSVHVLLSVAKYISLHSCDRNIIHRLIVFRCTNLGKQSSCLY